MTQPDPDPASLPEALPVLSYERQTGNSEMEWVLRFVGAWVICSGAGSVLPHVLGAVQSGWMARLISLQRHHMYMASSMVSGLASIMFGVAIARRYRYGFHGNLVVLVLAPVIHLAFYAPTDSTFASLASMTPVVMPAAALFAVLLSVLRYADAKGVLQPVHANRVSTALAASSIGFLVSRMGWLYLAQGGVVLAMQALFFSRGISTGLWSWQDIVYSVMYLAVGTCGLMVCQRKVSALWVLAGILPMHEIGLQLLATWPLYFRSGFPFTTLAAVLIPSVAGTTASVFMLCLLARKAARTRT